MSTNDTPLLIQLYDAVPGLKLTPEQESQLHQFLLRLQLKISIKGKLREVSYWQRELEEEESHLQEVLERVESRS